MIGKKEAFSRSTLTVLLVSLFVAVILLPVHSPALIGIKEGDKVKNIVLSDLDGKTVNTAKFFGSKPVVLVFWELVLSDSFLDYSLDELRFLNNVYNKYHQKEGLEIFAIYTPEEDSDPPASEISKVRDIITSNKIAFPVLIDNGLKVFREYGVIALPSTIMVNKEGTIEYIYPSFPMAAHKVISDQIKALVGLHSVAEKKPQAVEEPGIDSESHRLYQYSLQMYKSGLQEQAFAALNKSLASDEKYSWAYNLKGVILWKRGNSAAAAEEFQHAIERGNNIAAHINYAILLSEKGQYEETEKIIKSASYNRVDLKVRAHYLLGLSYKNMNKIDLAIRELELAESLFDVWASEKEDSHFYNFSYRIPILRDLSELYSKNGNSNKAMERLQKAVKIALGEEGSQGIDNQRQRKAYMVYE
jgi:tetratricopeptide (TPR) repeat protein